MKNNFFFDFVNARIRRFEYFCKINWVKKNLKLSEKKIVKLSEKNGLKLHRIWFHGRKSWKRVTWKRVTGLISKLKYEWFLKLFYLTCYEIDFTEKIVKSSYGTDFKVDFTKNSWNFFTQLALNLILRKKSWSLVRDLFSKLISRKILETELYNMLL